MVSHKGPIFKQVLLYATLFCNQSNMSILRFGEIRLSEPVILVKYYISDICSICWGAVLFGAVYIRYLSIYIRYFERFLISYFRTQNIYLCF